MSHVADKPITADGKEVGELVSTANDKSSGQVKKGSNNNPEGAPDATWWLRDVNITVGPGELACVVGRVGSGKSSLIGALLGMPACSRVRMLPAGGVATAGAPDQMYVHSLPVQLLCRMQAIGTACMSIPKGLYSSTSSVTSPGQ